MTTPNSTDQANSRARKKAAGLVRVEVWVPGEDVNDIREHASWLVEIRKGGVLTVQTKDQSDE